MLVNIGCGTVWHPDWVNLDHRPAAPEVQAFDIRKPLPFADGRADAVYSSHLLEHLSREDGCRLLQQCLRVLRPGGILRIVVPDLEDFCRHYLTCLSAAADAPSRRTDAAYNWAYLHLLDQHVRRRHGGELAAYAEARAAELAANPQVRDRLSTGMQEGLRRRTLTGWNRRPGQTARRDPESGRQPLPARLRGGVRSAVLRLARRLLPQRLIALIDLLRVVRAGEQHRVGYDRYALPRLLREAGFEAICVVGPSESGIPGFAGMQLDCLDGQPRKPGSLYVEARRPMAAANDRRSAAWLAAE